MEILTARVQIHRRIVSTAISGSTRILPMQTEHHVLDMGIGLFFNQSRSAGNRYNRSVRRYLNYTEFFRILTMKT